MSRCPICRRADREISEIPYSLLAFHPQFRMADLAATSKALAARCRAAACEAGLRSVRIGNLHLLK